MPQECGYVMVSPPHALLLPPSPLPADSSGKHCYCWNGGINFCWQGSWLWKLVSGNNSSLWQSYSDISHGSGPIPQSWGQEEREKVLKTFHFTYVVEHYQGRYFCLCMNPSCWTHGAWRTHRREEQARDKSGWSALLLSCSFWGFVFLFPAEELYYNKKNIRFLWVILQINFSNCLQQHKKCCSH